MNKHIKRKKEAVIKNVKLSSTLSIYYIFFLIIPLVIFLFSCSVDEHEKQFNRYLKNLKDKDWKVRAGAAKKLGLMRDSRATESLINTMSDPYYQVREESTWALGEMSNTKAVPSLITALLDDHKRVRRYAFQSLDRLSWHPSTAKEKIYYHLARKNWEIIELIGSKGVPTLMNLLKRKHYNIRLEVIEVLGILKAKKAIGSLIEILKDDNNQIQMKSVEALARIGGDQTLRSISEYLKEKKFQYIINKYVKGVNKKNIKQSLDLIIKNLQDEDSKKRMHLAIALGRINNSKSVDALISLLKDETPWVRESAAISLGKIRNKKSIGPLSGLLKDKYFWVRKRAVDILGEIKDSLSIKALRKGLDDNAWIVREAAIKALRKQNVELKSIKYKQKSDQIELKAIIPIIEQKMRTWIKIWKDHSKGFRLHCFKKSNKQKISYEYYSLNLENIENCTTENIKSLITQNFYKIIPNIYKDLPDLSVKYTYIYSPNKRYALDLNSIFFFTIKENSIVAEGLKSGVGIDTDISVVAVKERKRKTFLFCGTPCGFDDAFWINDNLFVVVGWSESYRRKDEIFYLADIYICNLRKGSYVCYRGPLIRQSIFNSIRKDIMDYKLNKFYPLNLNRRGL